jgi:hypothetical protein
MQIALVTVTVAVIRTDLSPVGSSYHPLQVIGSRALDIAYWQRTRELTYKEQ